MRKELLDIIVDKGIIAIAIVIIGYLINRSFEKIKFENSKNLELEKQNNILKNTIAENTRQKKFEILEKQLSEFYYPIYYRLQKDNAIWKLSPQLNEDSEALPESANEIIENEYILKNHKEIVAIIESKSHLIEVNNELQKQLNSYIKHITVYDTIRKVDALKKLNPIDFDAPYPSHFFKTIENNIKSLQQTHEKYLSQE